MKTIELRKRMLDYNMNQEQLAIATGIDKSRLSRLLNEKLDYTVNDVKAICKVLHIKQDDLINIFFKN